MKTTQASIAKMLVLIVYSAMASQGLASVLIESYAGSEQQDPLQPGDKVLAWRLLGSEDPCFSDSGNIENILHWRWLESEILPRSSVQLTIEREERLHELIWLPESGSLKARPQVSPSSTSQYAEIVRFLKKGKPEDAISAWQKIAAHSDLEEEAILWLGLRILEAKNVDLDPEALSRFRGMLRSRWPSESGSIALLEEALTRHFEHVEDDEAALDAARAWLSAETSRCPTGWRAARARFFIANALFRLELPEEGERIARQAVREQKARRATSLELADSSQLLGSLVAMQGRTDEALILMRQALDMQTTLAPRSPGHARSLLRLANLKRWLGAFAACEELLAQANELLENHPHDVKLKSEALMELGRFEEQRGKYQLARGRYLEIVEANSKIRRKSRFYVRALLSLGDQAFKLENFSDAEAYYQQVLEISKDRGATERSIALEKLGHLELERGYIDLARDYFEQSRATLEDEYQGTSVYAVSLLHLSRVHLAQGNIQEAEKTLQAALTITEKSDYPTLRAGVLRRLSDLEYEKGHLDEALRLQSQSVQLLRRSLPSSSYTAFFIGQLGRLAERVGNDEQAAEAYSEAIHILETLSFRLGYIANTDIHFRSSFREIYKNYIDLLIKRNKPEKAFTTLEAVRAKSFLAILAERDLDLWKELPETLQDDLEANAESYDEAMSQLWQNPALSQQERETILTDLDKNLGRRETILREIRSTHPEIASLRYPEPLDLDEIQAALAPDTLLLSFSLGKHETQLFAVTKSSFSSHQIPLNEEELTERMVDLRDLIADSAMIGTIGDHRTQQFHELSQTLHDQLLGPVEKWIDQAERLFIVPDGSLHLLPWAVLARFKEGAGPNWQYLVERIPIHLSSSGTVFAAIKAKPQPAGSEQAFVALADPDFSAFESEAPAQEPVLRSFLEHSPTLSPLPASRTEVKHLKKIYPQTKILLGKEASEEAVKNLGRDVRYLHFATHSLLDDRSPLNTAIVLSLPEKMHKSGENGLLQVWEITEQLRIDADLVVLSACETALGQKVYGEGLIGLTRAFHHAGARSVMASLWQISDESTSRLIESFYKSLKAGSSKDSALRKAQLQLIELSRNQTPHLREVSPYHWGAFQLYGDWR